MRSQEETKDTEDTARRKEVLTARKEGEKREKDNSDTPDDKEQRTRPQALKSRLPV